MSRPGAVTFKGNPVTLAGNAVSVGQQAPAIGLSYFKDGFKTLTLDELKGKPTLLSVVPSLDTGVCALQTKKFNESLAGMGDKVNAVTVSLDLPFAQNRFCGAEGITNMRVASDYRDRAFGNAWGTLIEELLILCRAAFVMDATGKLTFVEYVSEVTNEPNYTAALAALQA